ncbi:MAG: hypothetical protein ACREMP_10500 [Candidatus Tyrphobacter sp.]
MEVPGDIDAVLKRILSGAKPSTKTRRDEHSVLAAEDEAYLASLVDAVRTGRRAVLIVEDTDERLRYMFSNASPPEAVAMLGKVTEATGRRIAETDL